MYFTFKNLKVQVYFGNLWFDNNEFMLTVCRKKTCTCSAHTWCNTTECSSRIESRQHRRQVEALNVFLRQSIAIKGTKNTTQKFSFCKQFFKWVMNFRSSLLNDPLTLWSPFFLCYEHTEKKILFSDVFQKDDRVPKNQDRG